MALWASQHLSIVAIPDLLHPIHFASQFDAIACKVAAMFSETRFTSPHLTSPHLTSPHLTSPHLTSPHLTSPHLTSPHLTSPHLTSPQLSCMLAAGWQPSSAGACRSPARPRTCAVTCLRHQYSAGSREPAAHTCTISCCCCPRHQSCLRSWPSHLSCSTHSSS